jgi:hypothetical protein
MTAAENMPLAGWPGIFPEVQGYARTFEKPTLDKEGKDYAQTAAYEWTGGVIKSMRLTAVRSGRQMDPKGFKGMDKDTLGKRAIWTKEERAGDDVKVKLIVPLDDTRGLIIEARGTVSIEEMKNIAGKLDLDHVKAVLARAPRAEAKRSPEMFKAIAKGMTFDDVRAWAGEPEADIGSGIHIYTYKLPGGGRVLVGTPDNKKLAYIKHETDDGKVVDLLK